MTIKERSKEFSENAKAFAEMERLHSEEKKRALQEAEDELVDSSKTLKVIRAIYRALKAIVS